eukprot:gnl/TRDRNA2_/TRDRNA2_162569_c1_seq1.p1 gnl/TRDRNA2_/TRDRNA2_162569_c1~~gnl/TRDRNA2_/TRDRNA2_162569_c1_seq1.p1  ORF type:complete len:147 (-),score=25.87 gnl/TRDRNA2_/TRDRNA2_162569_c1_seq1:108-548(-)
MGGMGGMGRAGMGGIGGGMGAGMGGGMGSGMGGGIGGGMGAGMGGGMGGGISMGMGGGMGKGMAGGIARATTAAKNVSTIGGATGGGSSGEMEPGSWQCVCGNVNWPSRKTCNRRKCSLPQEQGAVSIVGGEFRRGPPPDKITDSN